VTIPQNPNANERAVPHFLRVPGWALDYSVRQVAHDWLIRRFTAAIRRGLCRLGLARGGRALARPA
jgi:hypothetical protein